MVFFEALNPTRKTNSRLPAAWPLEREREAFANAALTQPRSNAQLSACPDDVSAYHFLLCRLLRKEGT